MVGSDNCAASSPECGEGTLPSPTEGRCASCVHWRFDEPDWEYDELRFGECKAIKQREKIESEAVSAFPPEIDRWSDEGGALVAKAVASAKAIAVDGSGYYAAVRTAPDFGCVLHSPSDAQSVRPDGGEG